MGQVVQLGSDRGHHGGKSAKAKQKIASALKNVAAKECAECDFSA